MKTYVAIGQVISAILVIILVLIQERSSGVSGLLGGGGDDGGFYQTRRGLEKIVFISTIVLSAAFLCLSVLNLAL